MKTLQEQVRAERVRKGTGGPVGVGLQFWEGLHPWYLALITKILNDQFEMGAYISHLARDYYLFYTSLTKTTKCARDSSGT